MLDEDRTVQFWIGVIERIEPVASVPLRELALPIAPRHRVYGLVNAPLGLQRALFAAPNSTKYGLPLLQATGI